MTKTTRTFLALWLIFLGGIGSPEHCSADTAVTLHNKTEMHKMNVRISDVFDGVPAEIDRDIAQAPAPGKQVIYDVNVLTRIAQKYRLDWEPQSVADHVVISTPCTRITADTIREAVVLKIRESEGTPLHKNNTVDITFDNHALEVDLPADQAPDFTLNNFTYDPTNKHFRVDLVTESSSGLFTVPVTGHISIRRSVPVLAHRLEGGTTVQNSDIDWIEVPEDKVNASVVTDARQIVGREVRRDTEGETLLFVHDVTLPRFIKRGSLITMQIDTPYMSLSVQGKALQDGSKGDVVRVLNVQSNRIIEGTVSGPETVSIHTNSQILAEAQ